MEKKRITTSQELNDYYKLINLKLKKFSDMNIPQHKVAKYLKPGSENFNNFISEDDDLKNVDGIEVVLKDIIDDTYGAFKDGLFKNIKSGMVKKFENYTENLLELDLDEKSKKEHELALADIYDISLSYINVDKEEIHLYTVNDHGNILRVMVFSEEELKMVKNKIVDHLKREVKSKSISLQWDKKINVENVISDSALDTELTELVTLEDVVKIIGSTHHMNVKVEFKDKFNLKSTNYYLYQVVPVKF